MPEQAPEADVLTLDEIYDRFESEWVLIADPEMVDSVHVRRGAVVCHSKDRDTVYERASQLRLKNAAIVYTGDIPPAETAVIL